MRARDGRERAMQRVHGAAVAASRRRDMQRGRDMDGR